MSSKPIGIFDSGAGGLSIWKEINKLMPHESTIYFSDSKYSPYGRKGQEYIIERSIKNTEFLISEGAKVIIVACNTATTNAIQVLRSKYDLPFVGIEPAIKPAALTSTTNAIGILATEGTLSSSLFHETSQRYTKNKIVIEQNGDGIVELIETGKIKSQEMKKLLKMYLAPMIKNNIDCLVLGCTHYSFLIPILKKYLPKKVKIIDSGYAVAKQTKKILENLNIINTNDSSFKKFYTNGSIVTMKDLMGWKESKIIKIP